MNRDSVSVWLEGIRRGDDHAATKLWSEYFARLVALARKELNGFPRRAADEEDVALSVFKSLCLRARRGAFEKLDDRDDLWRLLVTFTRCKAAAKRRHEGRLKRSFRRVANVSLGALLAKAPSPADLASLNDEREHLLAVLPDDLLRQVALRKMEGDEIDEIAAKFDISPRSVDRKLRLIREAWCRELERSGAVSIRDQSLE